VSSTPKTAPAMHGWADPPASAPAPAPAAPPRDIPRLPVEQAASTGDPFNPVPEHEQTLP